jgi:hypothetical protein
MKYGDKSLRATWEQRLAELENSGLSGLAWCTRQGISYHKYRYWKARIESSETPSDVRTVQWLALEPASDARACDKDDAITLRIGAVVIEVRRGFDPVLLRDVVQVLSST